MIFVKLIKKNDSIMSTTIYYLKENIGQRKTKLANYKNSDMIYESS